MDESAALGFLVGFFFYLVGGCFGLWGGCWASPLAAGWCASASSQSRLKGPLSLCLGRGLLSRPSDLVGPVAHHEVERPKGEGD